MAYREYNVQQYQSVYDLIIQLYGSLDPIVVNKFVIDNRIKLTSGFSTDLQGLTISWDNSFGKLLGSGVATRQEVDELGTSDVFISSITFTASEIYSGYSFSTTTMDNIDPLSIAYSTSPSDAWSNLVSFGVSNNYYMDFNEKNYNLYSYHNGSSIFSISADDQGGSVSSTASFTIENQRDYVNLISSTETFPLSGIGIVHSMFHNMRDDQGWYSINDSITDDHQWIAGTYGSIPDSVWTPGLIDMGYLNATNKRVVASYSFAPLLATASSSHQMIHCSYKTFNGADNSFMEWGIGDFIKIRHQGNTMSISNPQNNELLEFIMGDDIKFDSLQYLSVDVIFSINDQKLRLVVNGKTTVVRGGMTYSSNGLWPYICPNSFNGGVYVKNYDLISSGINNGDPQFILDDIWYADLNGLSYDDIIIINSIRTSLDQRFQQL